MKVRALREALQHVANYDIDDKDYYYPNLAKIQALSISIFFIKKPWNMKKCIFPRDAQFQHCSISFDKQTYSFPPPLSFTMLQKLSKCEFKD